MNSTSPFTSLFRSVVSGLVVATAFVWQLGPVNPAAAVTLFADFNNLSPGDANGQDSGVGLGPWSGATSVDVIAGDLDASAFNSQYPGQSGTPQSLQGSANTASSTRVTSTLDAAILENDVWFSFLINQPNGSSRGGVDLGSASDNRFVAVGGSLRYIGAGQNEVAGSFSTGTDNLIVGNVQVDDVGNDTVNLWINPSDFNALGAPDLSNSAGNGFNAGGIVTLSVESYNNGSVEGGIIDHVILASSQAEFLAAIFPPSAVPEPATGGLCLLGLLGGSLLRRRRTA